MSGFAIGYDSEELLEKAAQLAKRLGLLIDNSADKQLLLTADKLLLKVNPFLPLSIEFNREYWQKRRDEGKKQGLVRACKPCEGLRIIDATAGWGRDAAVLASFGADVLLLERNPIMAAMLDDALERQGKDQGFVLRLRLVQQNAIDFLSGLSEKEYPHVIYIDPMHPLRQKSALVKKDLQILQRLIGPDEDARNLIQIAQQRTLNKVVVKWPQQLPALIPPSESIQGKKVRFDIYTRDLWKS